MRNLFILLVIGTFSFFNQGCKKSCDEGRIDTALNNYTAAVLAWSNDPDNKEKCIALESAINAYLDEIDGCDGVSQTNIDAVKASLNGLNCN